jgi:hypothetical protein
MNSTPSRRTSGWVLACRFAAGHHLSGKRHTNYTFRHRASRDLTDHGRASRWQHRAGWERSAYRIGASATTLAVLYGYLTDRAVTEETVMGALAVGAVTGAVRARYAYASARHHKRVVRPLWQSITLITESNTVRKDIHAYGNNHKQFISVPRNYMDNPNAKIRVTLPPTWEAQPREVARITQLIQRRLGGQWDSVAHYNAYPQYIDYIPSPAPPASFTFADILPYIEKARPGEIVVGMGTHNRVCSINLDSEAPHVALSMGTGGGKSSLLRLIIIQLIRSGCERIDILDIKRASHVWAKGIPGVFIHTTVKAMIDATAAFRKEMESRYDALENGHAGDFPRRALIVEEQNSLMSFARQYWADFRNELPAAERNAVPKQCPLISDIGFALFMGRQSLMNVFSVFQRMSANAAGGGDMRSQYGCKILARFDPQSWKSLVGTTPIPRSSRVPGRARFVLGDDIHEIQMSYMRERKASDWPGVPESEWRDEAREFALAHARVDQAADALTLVSADGAGSDDIPPMSLREMCEAGIVPVRYSTATRARNRAGEKFPAGKRTPAGILHNPNEVAEFFGNRSN